MPHTNQSTRTVAPKQDKPPVVEPDLLLKWGLALLGEERAREYLEWLAAKAKQQAR